MMKFPTYAKMKNKSHVPNHQPVYNEKPAANPMGLR
jgi:hypothetical protein